MNDLDRVEKLLALLLLQDLKEESEREKAFRLSLAGFSSTEIADLLDTTSAVIRTHLYEARKTRGSRASKSSTKAKPRGGKS